MFGDVPMNQYALSGTPFDLRGYYMGQYRDKSSHVELAEYRQMFNTDKSTWVKRMLHHLGFVAWGGCGFMGPTTVSYTHLCRGRYKGRHVLLKFLSS